MSQRLATPLGAAFSMGDDDHIPPSGSSLAFLTLFTKHANLPAHIDLTFVTFVKQLRKHMYIT